MKIIKSEQIRPVDVDDTLIINYNDTTKDLGRKVKVYDAVTNKFITMVAHEANIRLLLEEKHRGGFIIVWSRSGYEWAKHVVQALDLENFVDLVMSKPLAYIDDMPVELWMKDRVYLKPGTQYKR